jgi:hypothetical protein
MLEPLKPSRYLVGSVGSNFRRFQSYLPPSQLANKLRIQRKVLLVSRLDSLHSNIYANLTEESWLYLRSQSPNLLILSKVFWEHLHNLLGGLHVRGRNGFPRKSPLLALRRLAQSVR